MDKMMLNQFVSLKLAEGVGVNDNLDEWTVEDKERFVIDNDKKAEWAMGKINEAEKEIKNIEDEVAKFEIWLKEYKENRLKAPVAKKEKFENDVIKYVNDRMEEDKKYRLKTIYGNVSRRARALSWNYDTDAALVYLKENNHTDLIKVSETVDKKEFKKLFEINEEHKAVDENGEVIDFIELDEQGYSFTFKMTGVDK